MTSTTLRSIIVGSLSAIVFANCGKDPYSGETTTPTSPVTDTNTDTKTRTATATETGTETPSTTGTDTRTKTGPDTQSTTVTVVGTKTDSGTTTKTDTPTGTETATDTRTSTDTQTQTVTGKPDAGQPDLPIITETLTYTQTRTTTVSGGKDGGTAAPDAPANITRAVLIAPVRQLDLVFMIDNSPSMAPKVHKMNDQVPKLLAALKDPYDGTYPDLRVAIIDSDLGTGGQYASGSCGPNDSNNHSSFGDLGNFQVRGASSCGVNSDALWLEYTKGKAINYSPNQDISTVFSCLTSGLGSLGCGEEHSLQAFEFALIANSQDIPGRSSMQDSFLRSTADLGLVFLSDEDDCSAASDDGIFGDSNHPELKGESASLRCATRSHMCSGHNLVDAPPGYPTTASFSTLFSNCQARTDACPNPTDGWNGTSFDTTQPTSCSPLKSIKHMADELTALKSDPDKVFVAGIFGWPRSDADMAAAQYKIDLVPNPNSQDTVHVQVWDYWPVCYDPDHMPKTSGFDADAWGWGAPGGLRLSAFIDEFGANGQKYSICERDFSAAMTGIGTAAARKMQGDVCVPADFATGKTCAVYYFYPQSEPDGTTSYALGDSAIPQCPSGATNGEVDTDCWRLVSDQSLCPGTDLRVDLLRTKDEIAAGPLNRGTKLAFDCR